MMADFDLTKWFFEESGEDADNTAEQLLLPAPEDASPPLPPPSFLHFPDIYGDFDTELQFNFPLSSPMMSDPYIFNGASARYDENLHHLPLIEQQQSLSTSPPSSPVLQFDSSFCSAAMIPYARYGDESQSSDTSASDSSTTDDMVQLYMPSEFSEEAFLFENFQQQEEMDRLAIRTQRERRKFPIRFIKCPRRPYQCSDCEHTFRRLHDYRRHILTHMAKSNADQEYRWHCELCDQSFTRFFALKRHHKRKHKSSPPLERVRIPRAPPTPSCLSVVSSRYSYR